MPSKLVIIDRFTSTKDVTAQYESNQIVCNRRIINFDKINK